MLDTLKQRLAADGKVVVGVKVMPRAVRNEVVGVMGDGALKVNVAAVPERGKANEGLRGFLTQQFGVGKGLVAIIAGETSHRKILRLSRG
jgi:uncharacterized protein